MGSRDDVQDEHGENLEKVVEIEIEKVDENVEKEADEEKITKTEGNLGRKIDENSSRLSSVEETLAELFKA
ncbi:hypothetical protein Dimus_013738 [Dionaea muscipula]